MTTPAMWELLEQTRPEAWDPDEHAERVTRSLEAAGVEATLAFAHAFDAAMDALHRWDLWGATSLAFGGLSDDGFEYVRTWFVVQGEATWRRARNEPEALLLELLGDADEPDEAWEAHGLHEAEPLLYAAGVAHERLTGSWLPARSEGPGEPLGEPWDEDDLPARFPRLAAALPDGWADAGVERGVPDDGGPLVVEVGPGGPAGVADRDGLDALMDAVVEGLMAYSDGDHARSRRALGPLVDDPAALEALAEVGFDVGDVAYAAGMSRFVGGDPDGAAVALRVGTDAGDPSDPLRRGLAQVELARGALDAAAALLDERPQASVMDQALVATLAARRGATDDARRRAVELTRVAVDEAGHPWDLAGAWVQAGQVLAAVGDGAEVLALVDSMGPLLEDAPPELPLLGQRRLLRVSGLRLLGRLDEAAAELDGLAEQVRGGDRGLALAEAARLERAGGDDASETYAAAVEALPGAGETWLAAAVRAEAGA